MSPIALVLPLAAGFGYACGAVAIKRALGAGASASWVNFLCNTFMAVLFQGLWLLPGHPLALGMILPPVVCGVLFFLGQIFTFRAIDTGDVSVATPLLGSKVLLVALFSFFLIGKNLPHAIWLASLMASLGIAMISYSPAGNHARLLEAVAWSLAAAAVFALTDVLVQRWVPLVGYSRFAPLMFGSVGLFSLVYVPRLMSSRASFSGGGTLSFLVAGSSFFTSLPWLLFGALLLAVQALAMYSAIGLFGSATMTNILYGSRCLWSVLLVWVLGAMAGDSLTSQGRVGVMTRRLIGALLLLGAMTLVLE
ncbi:MAG: DMT family transporter [Verrucomicrobia bacterium]|nr:DMT family transporter [Verrucomicrobiota bacterium]